MNTAAIWILGYVSSKQSSSFHLILQRQFSLFDFSSICVIIHTGGTATLSRTNVDCVLLASMLNSIFVLLEKLSHYLATVIIRGVFRTLWNMMELLVKIHYGIYLHHSFLTGSWIHLWSWYSIFFLTKLPFKIWFFLRIAIKRETWVMTSHLANFLKKSRKRYKKYWCTVHSRTPAFYIG